MKMKLRNLILLTIICIGCSESDNVAQGEDNRAFFFKPVDPKTEVSRFSRELQINGQNFEGDMPISTDSNSSFIEGFTASASITKDNILFLPISYQPENSVVEAFLQLKNADNYWQIPVEPINNSTNLQIGIPGHTLNGNFNANYVLKTSNGQTSQVLETQVGIVSAENQCNGNSFPPITGNDGLTVKTYTIPDIGTGNLTITYNTFTVPDRLDVRYNNQWVASTGNLLSEGEAPPVKDCSAVTSGDGFLGTFSSFDISFDTEISNKLDVYVSGCLNNGTRWTVTVSCPQTGEVTSLWYENLPDCPCTFDEVTDNQKTESPEGEWIACGEASQTFHLGARKEVRWKPINNFDPGQQCTYDAQGNLITSGIAAGSPDLVSPSNCGIFDFIVNPNNPQVPLQHYEFDVKPWKKDNDKTLPCSSYLKLWPPNQGGCGNSNPVRDISHIMQLVGNMSCEEVTTLFRIGSTAENADFSIVPVELMLYLSGQNKNPPDRLLEMLESVANNLNCNNQDNDNCKVIKRAILNLKS